MAIATNNGHVARALDFYNTVKTSGYFIIGGTSDWETPNTPDTPELTDFRLNDVVGLKKVDNYFMVIPTTEVEDVISYRNQNWKKVQAHLSTNIGATGVTMNSVTIPVESVEGLTVGSKLRINNIYEGKVSSISGLFVTLDTPAPEDIPAGSPVIGGALVEGAKYVYVDCYLEYDKFPLVSYRQIGFCTGVAPNTEDVLRAAEYSTSGRDEYTYLGNLEILDNRIASTRDISQRELLSLIVEF